jgi:4-hydroxyphenylpyruvate dioxygenase-like putative hemolysin
MKRACRQILLDSNARTLHNPMGTDGFEFIEYAAPDPAAMGRCSSSMGSRPIARHRHKNVTLYRQGGVNFIVNAEPDSFAQRFARLHGPVDLRDRVPGAGRAVRLPSARWSWAPGASTVRSPGRWS